MADDNYAWEVWEAAGRYPPQNAASDLVTVRVSGEEVWMDTRRIRLRRRLPSPKRRICSYPPEDLVIEDYGRFLKRKGKSILSEERVRVEPFTTSILDGWAKTKTNRTWRLTPPKGCGL